MKKIEFIKPVYNLNQLPKGDLPTVVLCGRSNVGKSSFINSLFNSKKIAKTSSIPGKTRSINYYLVEEKFYIVDLPGFGYAKVSREERKNWQSLMKRYFEINQNIALAFHLIDARHNPMPLDIQLNQFIHEQQIPYFAILNKIDKLKQSQISVIKKRVIEFFPELLLGENLFCFSAITGYGKKDIVKVLTCLVLS